MSAEDPVEAYLKELRASRTIVHAIIETWSRWHRNRRLQSSKSYSTSLNTIRLEWHVPLWRASTHVFSASFRLTDNITSPYQYTALDRTKNEIRIFTLFPAASSEAPISGRIAIEPLGDNTTFDALSYTWGDPQSIKFIEINTLYRLGVTVNLAQALKDIRHSKSPRKLWIDAICIDQSNPAERGHQVNLMRAIYSKTKVVRTWLDEDIDPTLDCFRELLRLFDPKSTAGRRLAERGMAVKVQEHDAAFWKPVANLFSNHYWTRLWVQQELLLAPSVVLHCREHEIPAAGLFRFQEEALTIDYYAAFKPPLHGESRAYISEVREAFGFFDTILDGRRVVKQRKEVSTIENSGAYIDFWGPLLVHFIQSGTLQVSDVKDRVYGCLGLLSEAEARTFDVDYQQTLAQVYSKVCQHAIRTTGKLDFLCHYGGIINDKVADLPTWIPDPNLSVLMDWEELFHLRSLTKPHNSFNAKVLPSGDQLAVSGVQLGIIENAVSSSSLDELPVRGWTSILHSWYEELSAPEKSAAWYEDVDTCRLLCSNSSAAQYLELYGQTRATEKQVEILLKRLVSLSHSSDWPPETQLIHVSSSSRLLAQLPNNAWHTLNDIRRAFFYSTLFKTARQIGLVRLRDVTLRAQKGDEVWLIPGCVKAMVLRPVEGKQGKYIVIGGSIMAHLSLYDTWAHMKAQDRGSTVTPLQEITLL